MLIYRNAKRVHGQRKVGNPCSINLGVWGTLGGCMGCSLVKSAFFVYCVIKRIVDRAPRRFLCTRTRLRL